jgi:hypothetical protein
MRKLILSAVLFGWLVFFAPVAAEACLGDCSSDNAVTVDELLLGVNIALGNSDASQCLPFDSNNDQQVTIDEILSAVNNALNGCSMGGFAGDYSGDIVFDATHSGSINLSADANGQVSGMLVVTNTLRARFQPAFSFTFPAAGFSVTVSGTYDASTGSFEVDGSFVDGDGQTTSVNINGSLPNPMGSAGISVKVNDDVFAATLDASAPPMPTPTATPMSNPTPPTGGCADGILAVTFSNAVDTNADTSALTLGKSTALDQPDGTGNFLWVISGAPCNLVFGQVSRGAVFQGIFMPTRIQPGTYAIGSSSPPFLGVTYTESRITLDPTQNFAHNWSSKGGTLVVTDIGNGELQLHASGVTMVKGLVFQGATGTFTLEINGTIKNVMHN